MKIRNYCNNTATASAAASISEVAVGPLPPVVAAVYAAAATPSEAVAVTVVATDAGASEAAAVFAALVAAVSVSVLQVWHKQKPRQTKVNYCSKSELSYIRHGCIREFSPS
jgi:hypothetical protein